MPSKLFSRILVACSCSLGAYLSISKLGGFLVFGSPGFLGFCVFVLPVLAFPIQLTSIWNTSVALLGFSLLTCAYLGAIIYIGNHSIRDIETSGAHIFLFIVDLFILLGAHLANQLASPK